MTETTGSSPRSWPPPLFALTLLIGGAASVLFPQSFLPVISPWLWPLVGAFIILLGLACGVSAQLQFRRAGTPVDPTQPVTAFIEAGIYRYSRNPMYLCGCLLLAGLAVAINSLWILLGLPVFAFAVWRLAIRREERYLAVRFGDAYQDYKRRVPRWVGPF